MYQAALLRKMIALRDREVVTLMREQRPSGVETTCERSATDLPKMYSLKYVCEEIYRNILLLYLYKCQMKHSVVV